MISIVACCHGAKLYAHATRDFRSQHNHLALFWTISTFMLYYDNLFLIRFFLSILGTQFGSLEFQIWSLESEKIIIRSLKSERIGSLESEKSGPYRSIPGT